jgi:hypothetical protein
MQRPDAVRERRKHLAAPIATAKQDGIAPLVCRAPAHLLGPGNRC